MLYEITANEIRQSHYKEYVEQMSKHFSEREKLKLPLTDTLRITVKEIGKEIGKEKGIDEKTRPMR
jgi:hypothetical protein